MITLSLLMSLLTNTRCNVQLAGHVLEKDKSKSGDMENMMRALTDLVNNGQVDTHIGNMVNNVHEMRKDWERSASNCDSTGTSNTLLNQVQPQPDQPGASNYNSSEQNTAPSEEVQQSLEPVMYGPDGEVLSEEESKFLQDHIALNNFDEFIEYVKFCISIINMNDIKDTFPAGNIYLRD